MREATASKEQIASLPESNAEDLRKVVNRILSCIEKKNDANSDVKQAYDAEEAKGYDRKALKIFIKEKINPISPDLRGAVNSYCRALSELPLFAGVTNN